MKILLVEDDPESIKDYKSTLKRYEIEKNIKISSVEVSNADEAFQKLDGTFDGAIIDLKLNQDKEGGNKVIARIHEEYRIPIAVYTGTPREMKCSEPGYIGLYIRGKDGYDDIFNELLNVYQTGLTNILGGKGILENALNKVFWEHLPEAISHWKQIDLASEVKEKQLLRYTLSHLQEILASDNNGCDDKRNRAEIYIYPPVKPGLSAGLIVKHKTDNNYAMIITPSCDLAQEKAKHIQLVDLVNLLESTDILGKIKNESRKAVISTYVNNNKPRYHFLPNFGELTPNVLDFQRVSNIKIGDFDDTYKPICSISTSFYKDIVSRFSSYYARQGSPDFDIAVVSNEINDLLPVLNE
ncbi:MAG: hypothetical protein OEY06_08785 [Gammaproteobacteria bacterium]|nr:hypothetical protein [Gammaproteobacteria bacterium]